MCGVTREVLAVVGGLCFPVQPALFDRMSPKTKTIEQCFLNIFLSGLMENSKALGLYLLIFPILKIKIDKFAAVIIWLFNGTLILYYFQPKLANNFDFVVPWEGKVCMQSLCNSLRCKGASFSGIMQLSLSSGEKPPQLL